jgi:uncharacterized protein (TIGR00369 family)
VKFLDSLEAIARGEADGPPVARLVGMRLIHAEPGRTVFELDAGPQHANPMGTVHGGILCDLADGAMGTAYASLLDEGESFTTLELKINFLKPVRTGRLEAVGTVLKTGRTVGLSECRVTDEGGSLVAHATSTCMTLRGDAAAGR